MLGQVIKRHRLEKGMSQQNLYDKAFPKTANPTGRAYISRIENRGRQPSFDALIAIARALDTRPSTLLKEAGL